MSDDGVVFLAVDLDGVFRAGERGKPLVSELLAAAHGILVGIERQEVLGQPVSMLMPEPYQSVHDEYLRHHLSTGEKRIIGIGREVEALRKELELAILTGRVRQDTSPEAVVEAEAWPTPSDIELAEERRSSSLREGRASTPGVSSSEASRSKRGVARDTSTVVPG